jgi:hypothetical protein
MVQYIRVYIICPIPLKKMCVHLLSTAVCTSTVDFSGTKLWMLQCLLLGGIIENQNSDFVLKKWYRKTRPAFLYNL